MRLCPSCDAEFRNGRERCDECDVPLVDAATWEAEREKQGRRPLEVRSLVALTESSDRFEAEQLAHALVAESFHASIVASSPTIDGTPAASYAVVVPEEEAGRVGTVLEEARRELASSRAEAEAAAEAESGAQGAAEIATERS